MSEMSFEVKIKPSNALSEVRANLNADLVHEELHQIDEDREIGVFVFEKYYFRSKNRAALTVIAENLQGTTQVRAIATGSSEGLFFNFDWGAADNFVGQIRDILGAYVKGD